MRHLKILAATIGVAAAGLSCGSVVRDGSSPMFLVVDLLQGQRGGGTATLGNPLQSDVLTLRTTPAPCTPTTPCPTVFSDNGQVVLRLVPKNIGTTAAPVAPTTNNDVTISRYHVDYTRADGLNKPGIDVPYSIDGAVTGTVHAGTPLTLGFELVRIAAKEEAPLAALITSPGILTTIAYVTFYGQDLVGNVISAKGTIQIDFGNFGDF